MDPVGFWQQYKIPVLLGGGSALLIALSLTLFIKSYQVNEPIRFSTASMSGEVNGSSSVTSLVTVDVEGAVSRPGVYRLPTGSRVGDAIALAGGFTQDSDTEKIGQSMNLAAKLVDGAKLYIPKRGESPLTTGTLGQESVGSTSVLGVSINTASAAELDSLPGIGPVTAKKIIDNRPYQTLEELLNKKVLSPSLYGKLKDQLTL